MVVAVEANRPCTRQWTVVYQINDTHSVTLRAFVVSINVSSCVSLGGKIKPSLALQQRISSAGEGGVEVSDCLQFSQLPFHPVHTHLVTLLRVVGGVTITVHTKVHSGQERNKTRVETFGSWPKPFWHINWRIRSRLDWMSTLTFVRCWIAIKRNGTVTDHLCCQAK